jgi:hypothetical protein
VGRNEFSHFSLMLRLIIRFHGATARNGELQRSFLSFVFPYFLTRHYIRRLRAV